MTWSDSLASQLRAAVCCAGVTNSVTSSGLAWRRSRKIAAGTAPRIAQDESKGTYDPLCRDEHARIDWSRPVQEVYNLVRGCDPQPGAHTLFNGQPLRLYDARLLRSGLSQPGIVEGVGPDGIVIGALGGAIRAKRVRLGDRKVDAVEWATQQGVTAGTRLG